MKTMAAGKFKSECLRVMDEVRARRETVIVTKRGRPVVKIVPASPPERDILGCGIGTAKIAGDIESPILSEGTWEALR